MGAAAWVAAIVAAPLLANAAGTASRWSSLIYAVFAPVCHQIPSRSFAAAGHPFAVCARCFGVYAGFLAGAAAYPLIRRPRSEAKPPSLAALVVFTLPIGIDFAANLAGAWTSSNAVRFATGAVWGMVLPFLWVPGIADAVSRKWGRFPIFRIHPRSGR